MNRFLRIIVFAALLTLVCGCACAAATLELPASLTVIREEAFAGDTAIETVIVPEGVTEIESRAFADSGLSLIQLPSTLKAVADDAFEGVSGLKAVAAEGTWAYTYCTENNIPIQAFIQATPASHFEYDTASYDGEKSVYIYGAKTQLADVVIPEKLGGYPVIEVLDGYFKENKALKTLYAPDSIMYFSAAESEKLSSASFSSLTQARFVGLESLESVVIRAGDMSNYDPSMGNSPGIGSEAFKNCTNLKSVVISDDVEYISDYAFQNCVSLTEIKLPKSLEDISIGAFDGCTNLQKIEGIIPNNGVWEYTFRNCSKLESLVLLDDVYDIYATAFEGCDNLTLTVMPGSETIEECDELGLKYVVAEYGYGMINNKHELKFTGYAGTDSELIIPSKAYGIPVTAVADYALEDNETITSVTISEGITSIDYGAFYNCTKLKNVSLPGSLSSIGRSAFNSCKSIKEIRLPDSLTSMEGGVFAGCISLNKINIPSKITQIEEDTFIECRNLKNIYIPKNITSIGDTAFAFSGLINVTLHEGITEIGRSAFCNDRMVPEKIAVLNKSADISIADDAFENWNYIEPTIYCYKYSGIDAWATQKYLDIVYLDDNDFAAVGSISLPETMRIAAGKTDWVPLSIFPDLGDLDIMWISKNGDVATVSNGMITAKAPGTAEISVIIGDKTASMTLTVYLELTAFDLSATEITIEAGSTHQLSCTNIAPVGADAVFTYESSNTLAASVDANGLITASAIGDAVITVTSDSGVEQTCTVHVVRPAT